MTLLTFQAFLLKEIIIYFFSRSIVRATEQNLIGFRLPINSCIQIRVWLSHFRFPFEIDGRLVGKKAALPFQLTTSGGYRYLVITTTFLKVSQSHDWLEI